MQFEPVEDHLGRVGDYRLCDSAVKADTQTEQTKEGGQIRMHGPKTTKNRATLMTKWAKIKVLMWW